jgi:hypothetical protein
MNPNQKRPVLFVSNYCEHCKQVLAMLSKKGLRSHFLIANVDKHSAQLPSFVQRVPTILTENKEQLHRLAQGLIAHETLNSDEIKQVLEGKPLERAAKVKAAGGGSTGSAEEAPIGPKEKVGSKGSRGVLPATHATRGAASEDESRH